MEHAIDMQQAFVVGVSAPLAPHLNSMQKILEKNGNQQTCNTGSYICVQMLSFSNTRSVSIHMLGLAPATVAYSCLLVATTTKKDTPPTRVK